ncbi:MAG TPA: 50S ribosomal protein L10, partial [Candidatus Methylomirabilis sp.]|nr:50S ribosomal protein L10 [Candidatus Methylomirabilis sp.]
VEALKAAIAAQRGAVIAEYRGLKVSEMTALRKKLRAIDAEVKVVKNTLIRRAAEGTPFGDLSAHFTGPTAVAFSHRDPVALAKAMKEFAAATPKVTLRAGFVEGRVLSAKEVETLASVPSREVLLSRLVGGLASPITRLAQVLSGPPRKLAYVLESIRKQKPAEATAG